MVTHTFTLGRYTCVERLGMGPVGELWRAKRFGLIGVEKQFSLTRLHPALGKDAAAIARLQAALKIYSEFEIELEALAEKATASATAAEAGRLLHLIEQAAAPGGADTYIVCEFPGFADLRKLRAGFELVVERERAPELWPAALLLIGRSVATLLTQAQARGLWHGLLAPAAIYIGEGGCLRIGELGFAQALPATAWNAEANLRPLMPYLPKEVLSGGAPGPACDIFGLGAILDELCGNAASPLKTLAARARAANRAERPATMSDFAAALLAVQLSPTLAAEAQKALARLFAQFQLTGDSVPLPVTVSERSSAEPLPPPPGARSVDISKANLGGMSGRVRPSAPGAKPLDKAERKAAMRDISDISQPPRHVAPPPPETATIARHESEETPLPASRPLLVTNPKLATIPADRPITGPQAKTATDGDKKPRTGPHDVKQPRTPSRDDLRIQRARSGIDWLTSKSDQVPVDEASKQATAPQSGPQKLPQKPPSKPPQPEATPEKPAVPTRTPTPPSGQPRRRSNPVTINPRARAVAKPAAAAGSTSAVTPTAEVNVGEASTADSGSGTPSAATLDERPKSVSTLRGAAAALVKGDGSDSLSAGETNPQLAPIKVFPGKAAILGEEPTNPVSLEAVARAAGVEEKSPDKPKRRSGPISEPNPRVLSSTAPAEIVLVPGGLPSPSPDVLGNTGLAKPVPTPGSVDPQTQDFSVDGVPSSEPRKPRTGLLIGGALALMLAIGLVYLLVVASGQGTQTARLDGGANAAADAGAGAAKDRAPADTIVLTTTPPATVFLDGADKGKTPLTLKVAPGKHKLVLVAELYALTRRDATAGSKLDIKLEAAKLPADVAGEAALKVKCKSDGKMRILVDGNDSGRSCPTDELSVSPGKHVLAFLDPATDDTKEKKVKAKKGKKPTKVKVKY